MISERDQKNIIHECHSIAVAYLRMKAAQRKIYQFHGERLEDLAWDFIAEIFKRNEKGEFVVLSNYFEQLDVNDTGKRHTLLRKLIFTKVDDALFLALGERDPSLKKIIRNLKLAVKDSQWNGKVSFENGYLNVNTAQYDLSSNGSAMTVPYDFMFLRLSERINGQMQIPEILDEVVSLLEQQTEYRKGYSLTGLALLIRDIFVSFHDAEFNEITKPDAEEILLKSDFNQILNRCIRRVKMETGKKYLEKRMISEDQLNAYLTAAANVVKQEFNMPDQGYSHFDFLYMEMKEISYQEFRNTHRPVMEYLVKKIRKKLETEYVNEFNLLQERLN